MVIRETGGFGMSDALQIHKQTTLSLLGRQTKLRQVKPRPADLQLQCDANLVA